MHRYLLNAMKVLPHFAYARLQQWHRHGLAPRGSLEHRQAAFCDYLNRHHADMEISCLDVGARFGLEYGGLKLLERLSRLRLVGVEPDKAEAARLESLSGSSRYARVHPVAVWNCDGEATLHVTNNSGCSSVFEPDAEILAPFRVEPWFKVERKVPVPVVRLSSLFPEETRFDILKLDVQGGEYEILSGGSGLLKHAVAILLESHLIPIYRGQATFDRLHRLCSDAGFRLIKLDVGGSFDGEVVELNCVYIRDPAGIGSPQELLKRILAALIAENLDYVEFLLRNWGHKVLGTEEADRVIQCLELELKPPLAVPASANDPHAGGGFGGTK